MKIMALDVGERTVGVAVSDELEMTANPRTTLARDGTEFAAVARLAAAEGVGEIVVGHPLSLRGERGAAALRSEAFADQLRPFVAVPVRLWDERLTTAEAERRLIEAEMRRARRRRVVDRMAAAVLLDHYLRARALRREERDG